MAAPFSLVDVPVLVRLFRNSLVTSVLDRTFLVGAPADELDIVSEKTDVGRVRKDILLDDAPQGELSDDAADLLENVADLITSRNSSATETSRRRRSIRYMTNTALIRINCPRI